MSYSGNTEEVLSVLNQALKIDSSNRPSIVAVASGGNLLEIAEANELPMITLPGGYQPRMTFGYQLRALVEILSGCSLIDGTAEDLITASNWLKTKLSEWIPTVSEKTNQAKQLALDIVGKSAVIYAGPKL